MAAKLPLVLNSGGELEQLRATDVLTLPSLNIGGLTNPGASALRIQDATSSVDIFPSSNSAFFVNNGSGSTRFWNNGAEKMRLTDGLTIGGTNNPGTGNLEVVGTGLFSGLLTAGAGLTVNGTTVLFLKLNTSTANASRGIRFYRNNTLSQELGVDFNADGTNDFYLYNYASGKSVFYVGADGGVNIGLNLVTSPGAGILSVTGGLSIGGNLSFLLTKIITRNAVLGTPGTIGANSSAVFSGVSFSGVDVGDIVLVKDLGINDIISTAFVTATNTVEVRLANISSFDQSLSSSQTARMIAFRF